MTTVKIDPPEGWRYGFPKAVSLEEAKAALVDLNGWLVANGYPQEKVDEFPGQIVPTWIVGFPNLASYLEELNGRE